MRKRTLSIYLTALYICISATSALLAKTINGNDFALYLSEARDEKEAKELFKDIKGKNGFFRYLCIEEMNYGKLPDSGHPYCDIVAQEPSSYFDIKFRVVKNVSLKTLVSDPETKEESGIAITGRFEALDYKMKEITVNPVIVRHKDVLENKRGKELLGEVDSSARYYSFTAVKGKPVALSYADRDLLKYENKYKGNPEGWADFLRAEIAKRDAARMKKTIESAKKAGLIKNDIKKLEDN